MSKIPSRPVRPSKSLLVSVLLSMAVAVAGPLGCSPAAGSSSDGDRDGDGVVLNDCDDDSASVGACGDHASCVGDSPRRCVCDQWYVGDGVTCTPVEGPCAFQPAGTVCRVASGPCDVAEACDGTSVTCPEDGLMPPDSTCRAASGACDVAETCDGVSKDCGADTFLPVDAVCGEVQVSEWSDCVPNDVGCAVAEGTQSRSTTTFSCAADQTCHPSVTTEDRLCVPVLTELWCDDGDACTHTDRCIAGGGCAGTVYSCDVAQNGWTCAAAAACDGTGSCTLTYQSAGTTCRSASGPCDSAESCTGSDPTCPTDAFLPSTVVCRAAAAECDAAETCDGVSSACPSDGFMATDTFCSIGTCDAWGRCFPLSDGALTERTIAGQPFAFSYVTKGLFAMGSPESDTESFDFERPVRMVTLSRSFLTLRTEVTQAQWQAVMGTNPAAFSGDLNRPVETVSWNDAVEFCNRLSLADGLTPAYTIQGATVTWNTAANGYRLPTEAEWEYAARAGTTTPRSGPLDQIAWYAQNSGNTTHPVAQKQANAWNLSDMLGNVGEWTWDWREAYLAGDATDPTGPGSGVARGVRGGYWLSTPLGLRAGMRGAGAPHFAGSDVGLRVVRSVP